ncbi:MULTISPECIES: hypothetical protein [unclassified Crossiella]|uniref:hypothetical protein n=1 Tax=unclassified Crossiella TaxID=2620835 RepID=UPI001FFEBFF4|nr:MULTISPECIES: hypothetical protein [unclassified Crossiella]MCK2239756.1 hypothetical protein [Crossiella sp. S99.2]MCK2252451.1 hypothetical protein [Crossiella sp. S99.1]
MHAGAKNVAAIAIAGFIGGTAGDPATLSEIDSSRPGVTCEYRVLNTAGVHRTPSEIYSKPSFKILRRDDIVWAEQNSYPHPSEQHIFVRELVGGGWVIADFLKRTTKHCDLPQAPSPHEQ